MSFSDSTWEKAEKALALETMSANAYAGMIGFLTMAGFALSSVLAVMTMGWHPQSIFVVLGVGFIIPLVGVFIAIKSDYWLTSLAGMALVASGFGIISGPVIAFYKTAAVVNALMATMGVSAVMTLIGVTRPKSLAHWGSYLFAGLVALIFARIAELVMFWLGAPAGPWYMTIVDSGGAVLFSLFIIYDWNRALDVPYTKANAARCALALYLDIANLFLIFLRLFGLRVKD